jgi:hypothetical protein
MMGSRIIVSAASALLLAIPNSGAYAQEAIPVEVTIVLAKEAPGAIAPELSNMPALRRAPFNSFRSMDVLSRPRSQIRAGAPSLVQLPNGRRVQLELEQIMPDGRYRVKASINRPEQNDYLRLLQVVVGPGDPFVVAGQSHAGGTLVLVVRVGAAPAAPR